ncbi:hypothetical protein [Frankia umida]|nr:hypothetical protein [Frankia umida]
MIALAGCASSGQASAPAAGTTTPTVTAATAVPAAAASGASAGQGTRRITLAPVDQRGRPASGWTLDSAEDDPRSPIDCGDRET